MSEDGEIAPPEHLGIYIGIATELFRLKEVGAVYLLDSLSEGCWCCLLGANEGYNRATAEKSKNDEEKSKIEALANRR